MYAIFIRGRREPVTCDDMLGRTIKAQWVAGSDDMVEIEGVTFPCRVITRIEDKWTADKSFNDASNHGTEVAREAYAAHQDLLRKRKEMKIEVRAKDLNMAHHVWWAHTGKQIPQELHAAIIGRQLEYFKKNKNAAWANPSCYKDLMPKVLEPEIKKETDRMSMKLLFPKHAMELVERVLSYDV